MELETGATPQQIKEARERHGIYEKFKGDGNYEDWLDVYFETVAPLLVPVGMSIISDETILKWDNLLNAASAIVNDQYKHNLWAMVSPKKLEKLEEAVSEFTTVELTDIAGNTTSMRVEG